MVGKISSGLLLLKVIIRESHADSNATITSIRLKLTNLDAYMKSVHSYIKKFNEYVILLVQSLEARSQTTNDLMTNLFKGYLAASDKTFRLYITSKQDDYDETSIGNQASNAMTATKLMHLAKTKYDILNEKGEWNAPSAKDQIIALKAEVRGLKKSQKIGKGKKQQAKGGGKSNNKKRKKSSKPKGDGTQHPKEWSAPGQNDLKTRTYKGVPWHWCHETTGGQCTGKWRVHKPTECKGLESNKDNVANQNNNNTSGAPYKKKVRFQKLQKSLKVAQAVLSAQMQGSDEDTEEE